MRTHRFVLVIANADLGSLGRYHEESFPSLKMVIRRSKLWHKDFPDAEIQYEDLATGEEFVLYASKTFREKETHRS